MGNICRSPSAQGVFERLLDEYSLSDRVRVDSAGTYGYHTGESPDRRAIAAASNRGVDISKQKARAVNVADFDKFDLILAMDMSNLDVLKQMAPANCGAKIKLIMDYATTIKIQEVPDPYFGGTQGFEIVLDMIQDASKGLIQEVRSMLKSS
ncbi:MAG: low molecular weight phosphotyrosine protein phosphatase [Gammaproteobacteria bacterium]|nr:MAG: low molecular weight phosphotyrosine protein phosphatase [Gammaproteobacteria bacterium]